MIAFAIKLNTANFTYAGLFQPRTPFHFPSKQPDGLQLQLSFLNVFSWTFSEVDHLQRNVALILLCPSLRSVKHSAIKAKGTE